MQATAETGRDGGSGRELASWLFGALNLETAGARQDGYTCSREAGWGLLSLGTSPRHGRHGDAVPGAPDRRARRRPGLQL